ncbi:hypothetical protein HLB44_11260 [Aquincola sp. S2]|uniref:Uncharacterized protein n=1 Tax=Pseudaquabacterium terrae TaxID=2732868 RepID=A0ABX2EFZ8_9BURK|nr:hypothetical protein [Aquabacterium terrae]NRF67562.1 hypothetical protein [Aquabacterium terrae]
MALTASIQELLEHQREELWRREGVSDPDIRLSRLTGMDARDLLFLRGFAQRGYLFVIRCPKVAARAFHGDFQPKTSAASKTGLKTGTSGLAVDGKGHIMVSDYDLMSVWRREGARWTKIVVSAANGTARGPMPAEAQQLLQTLNQALQSPFQHGCQDDWFASANPGVKLGDHFAAIGQGAIQHLPTPAACEAFYRQHSLEWPYVGGRHRAALGG